ncbi:S10 family peptidase [Pseudoduganella sp. RAF19]
MELDCLPRRAAWAPLAATLAALLVACGGGGGGSPAPAPPTTPSTPPVADGTLADSVVYSSAATGSLASAQERAATLKAQLTLNGVGINYTATTGHLTTVDARTGQPAASFFYIAYTADNQSAATRPVTFMYNGGPGSSTLWLHLGSFGPRRIVTNQPTLFVPNPVQLVDNAESLLDTTDLVFVDAIGTGFSQAIAPNKNQDFWSVDADAASFRDFVLRYVAANNRQTSPKFLFGESYGAPRTAVLANLLESAGTKLNGIVLLSSILDYNANCGVFDPNQVSCEGYVPTYAAIGAYHHTANPLPADLNSYLQQARDFASGAYRTAMTPWIASRTQPPAAVTSQLNAFTGISALVWQQNFDMQPNTFQTVVPGQLTGRYDARVLAPAGSALAAGGDPSLAVVNDAFVNTTISCIAGTLHYTAGSGYVTFNDIVNRWNFSHEGKNVPDTVPDLAAAMTLNPSLKVMSLNGYYDLATPFYQTERDLARLGTNSNITVRFYQSGHMAYLDDTARRAIKSDLAAFYASAH